MLNKRFFVICGLAVSMTLAACNPASSSGGGEGEGGGGENPPVTDKYQVSSEYWATNITGLGYFGASGNITMNLKATVGDATAQTGLIANQSGNIHFNIEALLDGGESVDMYIEPLSSGSINLYSKLNNEWQVMTMPASYASTLAETYSSVIYPWKFSDFTYNSENHSYEKASDTITIGNASTELKDIAFKFEDNKFISLTFTTVAGSSESKCSITGSNWGTTVVTLPTISHNIDVTDVSLDKETLELEVGNTATLVATVLPSDATDPTVRWSSSDNEVATVNNGVVSALKAGSAVITATAGRKSATCTVTVKEKAAPIVEVTDITLNKETLALEVGAHETLIATVLPENATDKTVTWRSSDNSVATVENGLVTAISAGTAVITAAAGQKDVACVVTVRDGQPTIIEVQSVTVSPKTATIKIAETITLSATVLPENATDKTVTWRSSNDSVAAVSQSGVVIGVGEGQATITAISGNKTDTCAIIVEKEQVQPETITYTFVNEDNWDVTADNAKFIIWAWGGTYGDGEWVQVAVNKSEAGVAFVFTVVKGAYGCVILRLNPNADVHSADFSWDDPNKVWNKSENLALDETINHKFAFSGKEISVESGVFVYDYVKASVENYEHLDTYNTAYQNSTISFFENNYTEQVTYQSVTNGTLVNIEIAYCGYVQSYQTNEEDYFHGENIYRLSFRTTSRYVNGLQGEVDYTFDYYLDEDKGELIAFNYATDAAGGLITIEVHYHVDKSLTPTNYQYQPTIEDKWDDKAINNALAKLGVVKDNIPKISGAEDFFIDTSNINEKYFKIRVILSAEGATQLSNYMKALMDSGFILNPDEDVVFISPNYEFSILFALDAGEDSRPIVTLKVAKYEGPSYPSEEINQYLTSLFETPTIADVTFEHNNALRYMQASSALLIYFSALNDMEAIKAEYASRLTEKGYEGSEIMGQMVYTSNNSEIAYLIQSQQVEESDYRYVLVQFLNKADVPQTSAAYPSEDVASHLEGVENDTLIELSNSSITSYIVKEADYDNWEFAFAMVGELPVDVDPNGIVSGYKEALLEAGYVYKAVLFKYDGEQAGIYEYVYVSPHEEIAVSFRAYKAGEAYGLEDANYIYIQIYNLTDFEDVETSTDLSVQVSGMNIDNWDITADNAKFAVWAWGGEYGEGAWIEVQTSIDESTQKCVISFELYRNASGFDIVRLNPNADVHDPNFDWDDENTVWNVTDAIDVSMIEEGFRFSFDEVPTPVTITVENQTFAFDTGDEFVFDGEIRLYFENGDYEVIDVEDAVIDTENLDMDVPGKADIPVTYDYYGIRFETFVTILIREPASLVDYSLVNDDSFNILSDEAEFKIWAWGGHHDEGQWIDAEAYYDENLEANMLSFSLYDDCDGYVILRLSPDADVNSPDFSWDDERMVWNQSDNFYPNPDDPTGVFHFEERPEPEKEIIYIAVEDYTSLYYIGEEFEFDGDVYAIYNDGSSELVDPSNVLIRGRVDTSEIGIYPLTVVYNLGNGLVFSVEISIEVSEPPVERDCLYLDVDEEGVIAEGEQIVVWVWGGMYGDGEWVVPDVSIDPETGFRTISFSLYDNCEGFLFVRFAPEVEVFSWEDEEHILGQTADFEPIYVDEEIGSDPVPFYFETAGAYTVSVMMENINTWDITVNDPIFVVWAWGGHHGEGELLTDVRVLIHYDEESESNCYFILFQAYIDCDGFKIYRLRPEADLEGWVYNEEDIWNETEDFNFNDLPNYFVFEDGYNQDDRTPYVIDIDFGEYTDTINLNEEWEFDGQITVIYSDGSALEISYEEIDHRGGVESSRAGTYTIIFIYHYTLDGEETYFRKDLNITVIEPEEEPEEPELLDLVFANDDNSFDILSDDAEFAVWAWGGEYGEGAWVEVEVNLNEETEELEFSFSIYSNCDGFKFVRLNPTADREAEDWQWNEDTVWNETDDMVLPEEGEELPTFHFDELVDPEEPEEPEDPEEEPELLEITYVNTNDWDITSDRAVITVWAWGGEYGEGQWIDVDVQYDEQLEKNVFVVAIYSNCTGFKFVRLNPAFDPEGESWQWNERTVWNETSNMVLPETLEELPTFQF